MNWRFSAIIAIISILPVLAWGADVSSPALISVADKSQETPYYWTLERMQSAKPYPLHRLKGRPIAGRPPQPEGVPGGEDGTPPQSKQPLGSQQIAIPPFIQGPVSSQGYFYPFPFIRYQNFASYDIWPYRTVVKIFFKDGNSNFVCSGAVWPNRSILTAGHCVYNPDTKKGHTNFVIIPQYKNGSAPLGSWGWTETFTTNGWKASGDFSYDFGLIVTEKQAGRNISFYTGNLGSQWNISTNQAWTVIGYPAARPFNGNVQQICHGSFAENDVTKSPAAVGIGCDLTGGSSGCPWIIAFTGANGGNRVNGLMSYGYPNRKKASYSPYFGSTAQQFWKIARNKR
jgi:V8-like Glu-specific endopeptidase